jgi:integrase
MGHIYRRENSKFYWIKYYRNGKPFYESAHSEKKMVAERLLKVREGEISQGKMPGIIFEKIRFDDLLKDYLLDYRVNGKKTIAKAERCVKYLKVAFGGMRAVDITTTKIMDYIEKRKAAKLSNASINRELAALKRSFNLATRSTPPKVSQVPHIPTLKENNVRKGFLEPVEFLSLQGVLPTYLKPVVAFAYYTGWRRGEILSLKWNQIDIREGTVRLEPGETKNDEGRTIYLESEILEVMKSLHRNRRLDCPYVFNYNGEPIVDFRKSWEKACGIIKRPGLLFHDLRRSGIRNNVRAGIPERVAMAISGHKTRSVFDRYNIVSPDDLKEAALKRRAFNEEQAERLHSGDIRPVNENKGGVIKLATA